MSQTHLLLLCLLLSPFLICTNANTICGSSNSSGSEDYDPPRWADTDYQGPQSNSDSVDIRGTIDVECETTGGHGGNGSSSSSNNHLAIFLGTTIPIFIIYWAAVGVCVVSVQRKKSAAAAAALASSNPGQLGEVQMSLGSDQKLYAAPAGMKTDQPMANDHKV